MLLDVLRAIAESKIEEVEILATCPKDELGEAVELYGGVDQKTSLMVRVREDRRGLNELLNEVIGKEREPVLIIIGIVIAIIL